MTQIKHLTCMPRSLSCCCHCVPRWCGAVLHNKWLALPWSKAHHFTLGMLWRRGRYFRCVFLCTRLSLQTTLIHYTLFENSLKSSDSGPSLNSNLIVHIQLIMHRRPFFFTKYLLRSLIWEMIWTVLIQRWLGRHLIASVRWSCLHLLQR